MISSGDGHKEADRPVRVRFAPSPTGHLHIGGLRGALFNWLFARNQGGKFIIRIEDTDIERSKPEYVTSILEAFKWVNIESDEPIQFQTKRFDLYRQYIDRLLAEGKAYWSDPAQEENGKSAVRFRLPKDRGMITFKDLIRGEIAIDINEIGGDFVIARADGTPLYNFVATIDDIDMKMSHIIRGEEHIPNTPKQILLYEAFGEPLPLFAHLPLILGPSGTKLSKRDGATSVIDYKAMGFLPDALCNYLVRLGWAHGDQEIFERDELIKLFSLDAVHKAGAIFDMAKLSWMNGVYLHKMENHALVDVIVNSVQPDFLNGLDRAQVERAVGLYKERTVTLVELAKVVGALFKQPDISPVPAAEKWGQGTKELLAQFLVRTRQINEFSVELLEKEIKAFCAAQGNPLPALLKPIRFALTGTLSSPSVYELCALIGRDETEKRIRRLIEVLS